MIGFKAYLEEGRAPNKTAHDRKVERLGYLAKALNKNGHRWGENPSQRMMDWVDEYNDIKADHKEAWKAHCEKNGYTPGHDAYDCLA